MREILGKVQVYLREHGRATALELLVNFVLPYVIYVLAQKQLGDVKALMASSAPPILWSIVEFARHRRIDALSILVLLGIGLSLLAFVGGGGVRFLQLREKLVTVIIGCVFLGSAAIGRPLIYQLARASMMRKSSNELQEFESLQTNKYFRRVMMIMTLVWGFGLLADAAVSAALIFTMSIGEYLIVGPIIGYSTMGALSLWTWFYAQHQRRKGKALRAAEARRAAEVQAG
ncbi:MAG TPA: VC0807 family protein [Rhizomicrobium sp.]|nr:VC0807 family protein [Rhizomicrobium sp.]